MCANQNLISPPIVGSTTAAMVVVAGGGGAGGGVGRSRGFCLPLSTAASLLTIVFLIVIENVSSSSLSSLSSSSLGSETQFFNGAGGLPSSAASATANAAHSMSSAQHVLLSDTHRLAKRMDLEACLGQFDVHANTIIRTGDSQAIGGKFLQGLELDTMEQCQRLCCETESCDVFIFESKNGSYCYLFECGPPENFHCKFTRHANFTSAVLTPIKRYVEITTPRPAPPPPQPPLPPQPATKSPQHLAAPSISQQEWELTSLKIKPETAREKLSELEAGISSSMVGGGNIQSGQQQLIENKLPQQAIIVNNSTPHCGRFQFTCHSGECIAVYNACDGIPQCEDGSDEGPECSAAQQPNGKANIESVNILNSNTVAAAPNAQKYQPSLVQQTPQQQLQTIQQQQRQMSQPINTANVNNREDANAWVNRKLVAETQESQPVDLNSHIFTHKNGLQLPHAVGSVGIDGATNIGSIDLSTGIASYPNPNVNGNINPNIYGTNAQRVGIYMPQAGAQLPQQQQIGGRFAVPQQQTLIDQQGHIYAAPNINWAQQQQQQSQQQSQQFPAVVTPLANAPSAYVISSQQQQQAATHFSQQQQSATQQQTSKPAYLTPAYGNVVLGQQPAAAAAQPQSPTALQQQTQAASIHDTPQPQKTGEANNGSTKKALDNTANASYETDYEEDESTEPPKKKTRKHKKIKQKTAPASSSPKNQTNDDDPVRQAMAQRKQSQLAAAAPIHEQYKMIHENLAMEFRDHDGQSDRPGGAVLSLTLGLLITAALAILIGCRMRTVGRRARRLGGKTPYSHEADFLVNGMYL